MLYATLSNSTRSVYYLNLLWCSGNTSDCLSDALGSIPSKRGRCKLVVDPWTFNPSTRVRFPAEAAFIV